jgi:predicted permease
VKALQGLGEANHVTHRVRGCATGTWIERVWRDATFGVRNALRTPTTTAVIVCTLGLGIAATSVSFSLVNGFFIRPLPVRQPERFVRLYNAYARGVPYFTFSYPDFVDMRALGDVFADAVAEQPEAFSLGIAGPSERVWGELVSDRYFTTLGLRPAFGRFFLPDEESVAGGEAVVVLGHGLWTRLFGRRPGAVNDLLAINGRTFRIVGVAPDGFTGTTVGFVADLWIPVTLESRVRPSATRTNRGLRGWFGMARLKPDASVDQARAAVAILASRLQREYPDTNTGVGFTALAESEGRIFPMLRGSVLGFSAVTIIVAALVLVIACANIAGLLLIRASARRTEIGIRLALGATQVRIVAQLLTESAILSLAGGVLGLGLAWQLTRFLTAVRVTIARGAPISIDVSLDARVLAVSGLIVVVAGLLFGLTPALEGSQADLITALKDGRSNGARGRGWSRSVLVGTQIAVSMVLLAGGGLFLRSLQHARGIDLGFDPSGVVATSIDTSLRGYSAATSNAFWQRLREAVRRLPQTESASLAARLPLDLGISRTTLGAEGYMPPAGQSWPMTEFTRVDTDYFRTMRIPLVEGRDFTEYDTERSPDVVVLNDVIARQFWPTARSVVGRHVVTPAGDRYEVVGVARRSKYFSVGEDPKPYVYFPLRQGAARTMTVVARASGDPGAYLRQLVQRIRELDPVVPVYDVTTMSERVATSLAPATGGATTLAIVGALALILTALGLYGVVAQTVGRRTYEIGVRRALGAQDSDVVWLVMRDATALVGLGLCCGVGLGLGSGHLLRAVLYSVDTADPVVFGIAPLVLVVVCLAAAWVPTWRAVRINTATALRYE